jgi:hypothetical protein
MSFLRRKPDQRLRLPEVMQLRKAYIPDPLPADAAADWDQAKRRCLACPAKKLCDEALRAGDAAGFSLFCPNTHYIGRIRSGSLRF